jgi:hypothetical protein
MGGEYGFTGIKRLVCESDRSHLVPRLRICGGVPSLCHMLSWRGASWSTGTTFTFTGCSEPAGNLLRCRKVAVSLCDEQQRERRVLCHVLNTSRSLKVAQSITACHGLISFLDALAKLRKATISFVMCVCPSVHMEQLGTQWTDFFAIGYMSIFRKSVEKIKLSLKHDKNNGYFNP